MRERERETGGRETEIHKMMEREGGRVSENERETKRERQTDRETETRR